MKVIGANRTGHNRHTRIFMGICGLTLSSTREFHYCGKPLQSALLLHRIYTKFPEVDDQICFRRKGFRATQCVYMCASREGIRAFSTEEEPGNAGMGKYPSSIASCIDFREGSFRSRFYMTVDFGLSGFNFIRWQHLRCFLDASCIAQCWC